MLNVRRTGAADYPRWIKMLVIGDPGAGKTLFSSTWPDPIIASAEGGLMSIADRGVPYIEIPTSATLLQLKQILDQPADVRENVLGVPVQTVVIDTIDEIQKILMKERTKGGSKSMELKDWGWLGDQMRAIITGFRNLDMNVVMTCHPKNDVDQETGRVAVKPLLSGAIADEISAYFDLAVELRTQTKTEVVNNAVNFTVRRFLRTVPDNQHTWIKDRSGKLPPEFEINFQDDAERIHELIFKNVRIPSHPERIIHENELARVAAQETAKLVADLAQDAESEAEPEALPDCADCGAHLETKQALDLAQIRFRRPLCTACFKKASRQKAA